MSQTLSFDAKWKLGVVHSIRNSDFRFPRHGLTLTFSSSIYSAGWGGQGYTTITVTSNYNMDALLGVGVNDRLTTYLVLVNAVGQREERLVHGSVGHDKIVVQGALDYVYVAGDGMTLMTTAWPATWESESPFSHSKLYLEGYGNSQGLKLVSFDSAAIQLFSQVISGLISNTTYELKTYYKLTTTLNQPISIVISADGTDKIVLPIQTSSVGGDWQRLSVVQSVGGLIDWRSVQVRISQPIGLTNMSTVNPLRLDSIVLQQASGTSDSAQGSYTFTEFPDSVSQSQRNVTKPIYRASGFASNRKEYADIAQRRRSVKASFNNVSETFLQSLLIFKAWQDRGYLLCLETPYFDLKPWLIGTMYIDSINKDVTNLEKNSINFTFIET